VRQSPTRPPNSARPGGPPPTPAPPPRRAYAAQPDTTLERLGKRFEWGHIDEAAYQAEWQRLQALRAEFTAPATKAEARIVLDDVLTAWREGDAQGRREFLRTLFEELDVRDGRIVGYRPKRDHEVDVARLMDWLFERRTDRRDCSMVGREVCSSRT
jgi:hypothetical protein